MERKIHPIEEDMSILATSEGRLLARAVRPGLNSRGRGNIRREVVNFCNTPERYNAFSGLVRDQLTDDMGDRRAGIRKRIGSVDDLLVEKFGDPEKVTNTRLYFYFAPHAVEREQEEALTNRHLEVMKDSFVKGERNVLFVENALRIAAVPEDVVYPKNAQEFGIALRAEVSVGLKLRGVDRGRSLLVHRSRIRQEIESGLNPNLSYIQNVFGAVDILNAEGYGIGLLFEEGLSMSSETILFIQGRIPLEFDDFKRLSRVVHADTDTRDRISIQQVREMVETTDPEPTNVLVLRGSLHGGILEHVPPSYVSSIQSAESEMLDPDEEYMSEYIGKLLFAKEEPTDEEWWDAYLSYMEEYEINYGS